MVSVVIPALNSAETIADCIKSVTRQSYPNHETIVVDGLSSDETVRIAMSLGAKVLVHQSGRSAARVEGALEAHGSYLLFLDSDQSLSKDVLSSAIEAAEQSGAEAIQIPEEEHGYGPWFDCRALDQAIARGADLEYPRFISRAAYFKVGGHSRGLTYLEDRELLLKLRHGGVRIARARATIHHELGYVNPLELGRKTVKYAADSEAYYSGTAARGLEESPMSIIFPRLRSFLSGIALRSTSPATVARLPVYALVVHGPKLLRVLWARLFGLLQNRGVSHPSAE